MNHTKSSIRDYIVAGKLNKATAAALEYAEYCGIPEIINAFSGISARSKEHHKQWTSGRISYEDFSIQHARLVYDITNWLEHLPDHPVPASKRKKLWNEKNFKNWTFYSLSFAKLVSIFFLLYAWDTGSFMREEIPLVITLMIPLFAVFFSVMLNSFIDEHQTAPAAPRYISGPLVTLSYWIPVLYFMAIFFFVKWKSETMGFTALCILLTILEFLLGVYVGQILFSFFRKRRM